MGVVVGVLWTHPVTLRVVPLRPQVACALKLDDADMLDLDAVSAAAAVARVATCSSSSMAGSGSGSSGGQRQ